MSENGPLPEGWATATIGDLVSPEGVFYDGDWVESKDQDPDGDVRLIQLADVGDGLYLDKSNRFLTTRKAAELRCTFLQDGDLLVARMPDPLGRACLFPGDRKRSVTVVDVCIVRTGTNDIDHRWLMHFINSPQSRINVASLQSGSTRQRISRKNLATIGLPVPPTNEQRRIVAKIEELFSDLDAGAAALERVRANLKRYRASVLKAAVEGRLTEKWRKENPSVEPASNLLQRILAERRKKWEEQQLAKFAAAGKTPPKNWRDRYEEPAAPDTTNLPELPKGWCWARVDQLTYFVTSGSRGWAKYYANSGSQFIRAQDINTDRLRLDSLAYVKAPKGTEGERTRVRRSDLLITITGANVTKSAIVDRDIDDGYVSQHVALARCVVSDVARYLYLWIVSPTHGRRELEKLAYGAGKPGLNLDNIRDLRVAMPPLAEQSVVVSAQESLLYGLAILRCRAERELQRFP